jgi:hypothetical protein
MIVYPEDGSGTFLRNIGKHLPENTLPEDKRKN